MLLNSCFYFRNEIKVNKITNTNIKEEKSFLRMFFTTGAVAFAQVVQILVSVVKTKITAVLLGASGVGILGIFTSLTDIAKTISNLGIQTSSVKDVAQLKALGKPEEVNKIYTVLLRVSLFLGIIGFCLMVFFSHPLSVFSFGNKKYTTGIIVAGISVIFAGVGTSFSSFLQGIGEIKKMATAAVVSSLISCSVILISYYFMRERAIPLSFVIVSLSSMVITYFFINKNYKQNIHISTKEIFSKSRGLVKLGFFLTLNSFASYLLMYFTKIILNRKAGLIDVGIYQAVFTIINCYLGILLNAMLSDYYPRLSRAFVNGKADLTEEINNQAYLTFVLGNTAVIVMLILSKFVLFFLYSDEFLAGDNLFTLYLIGGAINYIGWTVGVSFMAEGNGIIISSTTIIPNVIGFSIILFTYNFWGINSCGIAYIIQTFIASSVTLYLAKKHFGFSFNKENKKCLVLFSLYIAIYLVLKYCVFKFIDKKWIIVISCFFLFLGLIICIKMMLKKVSLSTIKAAIRSRLHAGK
jgi:enterobacterial common antigen flippase